MTLSHNDLVDKFGRGATSGKSTSMFIEGDILYSYGHHFPLLIRWNNGYLMNADKYSVTTSCHQSNCWRLATIQIPFSALRRALKLSQWFDEYNEIHLIHKEKERWDETGKWWFRERTNNYKFKKGRLVDKEEKETIEKEWEQTNTKNGYFSEQKERRPESSVLEYKGNYYLSSMDGQNYFISLLPEKVKTVKEAFDCLVPEELWVREYKRQGEWFFHPVNVKVKEYEKWIYLPQKFDNITGHHQARDYFKPEEGHPLVRGTIRHDNGDHRMLKLGEQWHEAIESRHLGSWGASGKVD